MYFKDQEYKKALTRVVTSSREIIFKNQTFHLYSNLSLEDALNLKSIKRFVSSEIISKYPKIRSLKFLNQGMNIDQNKEWFHWSKRANV